MIASPSALFKLSNDFEAGKLINGDRAVAINKGFSIFAKQAKAWGDLAEYVPHATTFSCEVILLDAEA